LTRISQLFIALLLLSSSELNAQQGQIFAKNIKFDSANVGEAELIYFAKNATSIKSLNLSDVNVFEADIPVNVLSVTCPPATPAGRVSSVLTIDVSGSMSRGGPNITLAKAAAEAWISALGDTSECAITSFDHRSFLNMDFTSNLENLLNTLPTLVPRGGTDYQLGFNHPLNGGLSIAKNGKYKRVMVFLTDGFGVLNPTEIINRANEDSITVYCVSLGLSMPDVLRNISEKTGGLWFENVTTVDEAVLAYKRIFSDVNGARGCVVRWQTSINCDKFRSIRFKVGTDTASFSTFVPDRLVSVARLNTQAIEFGGVGLGSIGGVGVASDSLNKRIVIRSYNNETILRSIKLDRTDAFEMTDVKTPVTIKPGDSIVINVKPLKVSDSTYLVGRVSFNTTPCPLQDVYLTLGSIRVKPRTQTLRVVHPNGGESFLARSMVLLQYEGVPPTLPVNVEISSNGGRSWQLMRQGNTGNQLYWEAFNETRDSCLLRVTHELSADDLSFPFVKLTSASFFDVSINNLGTLLATTEYVNKTNPKQTVPMVRIWKVGSGEKLSEFEAGERVLFIGATDKVVSWNARSISVYSTSSKSVLWQRNTGGTSMPTSVTVSEDGKNIVVTGISADSSVVINAATGDVMYGSKRSGKPARMAAISGNSETLAICEADSVVRVIDLKTNQSLFEIREPGVERFYSAHFSPSGRSLIVTNSSGQTELWDVPARKKTKDIAMRQYVNDNTYCAFTDDGLRVAVETGRDQTRIFEVATGNDVVTIKRTADIGGVQDAKFSADGQYLILTSVGNINIFDAYTGVQVMKFKRGEGFPSLATSKPYMAMIASDRSVGVVEIQSPMLQQDVSDALWRVYRPRAIIKPIRFASRFVGQTIDTVFKGGIKNTGNDPIFITKFRIEGSQASEFSVSTAGGFVLAPGDSANIEYSFHPKAIGERSALIVCETSGGIINGRITGPCRGQILAADGSEYDVGTVDIGSKRTINVPAMITNRSTKPITINNMKLISPIAGVFAIQPSFPIVLQAGQSVDIPVVFAPPSIGTFNAIAEIRVEGLEDPVIATVTGKGGIDAFAGLSDPTTFRSILLPSAVIPKQGTVSTGVYDVLGLFAGYSITDNFMVQAGGALPLPSRWLGVPISNASYSAAWSIGAKVGFELSNTWIIGGGYQYGKSYYDQDFSPLLESQITFSSLWASTGFGNDDSRLNVYLGYTFKRHVTGYEGSFNADATTVGLAYDYRFAEHWKICSEAFFLRTMTFVPITVTARYFRESDAFEFGFVYVGIAASGATTSSFPFAPMVSWLKRW